MQAKKARKQQDENSSESKLLGYKTIKNHHYPRWHFWLSNCLEKVGKNGGGAAGGKMRFLMKAVKKEKS